jgi:hypothetical protein
VKKLLVQPRLEGETVVPGRPVISTVASTRFETLNSKLQNSRKVQKPNFKSASGRNWLEFDAWSFFGFW